MDKPKRKNITWGEAAKMVLDNSPCPLTHKEILQVILEKNLKEVKLSGPSALACINAMLHANSRSPTDLFHKVEGRSGCYRLNFPRRSDSNNFYEKATPPGMGTRNVLASSTIINVCRYSQCTDFCMILLFLHRIQYIENRAELRDSSVTGPESSGSSSVLPDTNEQQADLPNSVVAAPVAGVAQSTFPMPTTVSGSLPPISSMLGGLSGRVTTITSVASSVACAIANSRLNSLIAPSCDNVPLPSALSKKRSVKPHFQGDAPTAKKPRVTFKLDKEKKGKQDRPSRPAVKTKAELKYMGDEGSSSKNFIPPVLKPPMDPTHTVVKGSAGAFFGQKKPKKMSIAAQVKRSKEGLVDLVSPDSLLSKINVRTLINHKTFNLLPPHYQYQLAKLLPECDREVTNRGDVRPTSSAFSNEFFTSAFRSWRERLSEGEFTPEMTLKIQQEQDKFLNLDPWKTKHFEPVWGEKLLGERYVSPVDRSLQIMDNVHHEWAKELERLKAMKRRGTENEDLSAPNKMDRKHPGHESGKNLTTKQRAALLRQQKLASAKSANKTAAAAKKSTSRGNGGKNSSKDAQMKDGSTTEKAGKVGEKTKPKAAARTSKQNKANRGGKTTGSGETTKVGTIVGAEPGASDALTTEKALTISSETPTSTTTAGTTVQEPPATEKPPTKTTKSHKKKVTVKGMPKVTVVTKQSPIFHCTCLLKSMVVCRMCGAFCHADCINPMSVCRACAG